MCEGDEGEGTVEGRAVYENGFEGEVWRFGLPTAQTTTNTPWSGAPRLLPNHEPALISRRSQDKRKTVPAVQPPY